MKVAARGEGGGATLMNTPGVVTWGTAAPNIVNLVCQGACGLVDRTGWGHTVWWAGSY